jgi:hypothetical protein
MINREALASRFLFLTETIDYAIIGGWIIYPALRSNHAFPTRITVHAW